MVHTTQTRQRVAVTNPASLDELLNAAVEGIIPDAIALNHGIKVTRVAPGDFIVETEPSVACGYTVFKYGEAR